MGQAYLGTTELNKLFLGATQINDVENSNAPFIDSMVYWFKDGSNNITGSNWNNAIGGGITGTLQGGASKSGSVALLDNSSTQDDRFSIAASSGTTNVKSALVLFNQPLDTATFNAYFCGEANQPSPIGSEIASFENIYTLSDGVYGNNATFFGYVNGGTPQNLGVMYGNFFNDPFGGQAGGTLPLQWLGPNGRFVNNTKRIFFFNYNPNVPLPINTGGWKIGSAASGITGGSMGLFEMIGYDRSLSFDEFGDLIKYLKGTGVIS